MQISGADRVTLRTALRSANGEPQAENFSEPCDRFAPGVNLQEAAVGARAVRSAGAPTPNLELEKSRILKLMGTFRGESRRKGDRTYSPVEGMERLLRSGALTQQKDRAGSTLLEHLEAILENPSVRPEEAKEMAAWSIIHAAFPKRSYAQVKGAGTCVATSLSHNVLQENPAEVFRWVRGLAVEGQVAFPSGEVVHRARDSGPLGLERGTPVEQLLQATLTDYADPNFSYDLVTNTHYTLTATRKARLWTDQQLRLCELVTGRKHKAVKVGSGDLEPLFQSPGERRLAADLFWEEKPGVNWVSTAKHGRHLVTVTGVDERYVYLRDPHGDGSQSLPDTSHQARGFGYGRMTRQEFDRRLHHLLVPADLEIAGARTVERSVASKIQQWLDL